MTSFGLKVAGAVANWNEEKRTPARKINGLYLVLGEEFKPSGLTGASLAPDSKVGQV